MKTIRFRPKLTGRSRTDSDELNLLKGSSNDGKERMMVLGNDTTRSILVPDRNRKYAEATVEDSQYEAFKDLKRKPPYLQKQEYMEKMKSDNQKKVAQVTELSKVVKNEKLKKSLPKEVNKDKIDREKYFKKRSEILRVEEEDVIKVINSEIAKAKCLTVVKKQIQQNAIKNNEIQAEKEKQDKEIVEIDNALYEKRKAEEDERKKQKIETIAKLLHDQLKIKRVERAIEQAEMERERTNIQLFVANENRKNKEELEKKGGERKNLLKQQKDMILVAQILKHKEMEENEMIDKKIKEMRNLQEEKERIAKNNLQKIEKERSTATNLVVEKIREEQKLKLEAEEFAVKRRDDEFEREWRQKEKERIVREVEKRKRFREEIEKQIDDKYRQKTKEIIADIEQAQRIKDKLKEMDMEAEQNEKIRQEKNLKFLKNLKEGVEEKIKLKEIEELKEEKVWAALREMDEKKREYCKKRLDEKMKELELCAIDERLMHSIKSKAEELKQKELG